MRELRRGATSRSAGCGNETAEAWLLGLCLAGCYSSFGTAEHGECTTSADCEGRACLRVPDAPGGFWMCEDPPPPEVTECVAYVTEDCCNSSVCTAQPDGICYRAPGCCGFLCVVGASCLYDECDTDADCTAAPHGICIPRSVRHSPRRTCSYGACRTAADCTAAPGGYCAPIDDGCCDGYLARFVCDYPGGCRSDDDCGPRLECRTGGDGTAHCSTGGCPM